MRELMSAKKPLLPSINDPDGSTVDQLGEREERNQLGTVNGVYVPCLLNILGAVLFLRIGYATAP